MFRRRDADSVNMASAGDGEESAGVERQRRRGPVREIQIVDVPKPSRPIQMSSPVPVERVTEQLMEEEWPPDHVRRKRLLVTIALGVALFLAAFGGLYVFTYILNAPNADQQKALAFIDHASPKVERLYALAVGPAGQESFADPIAAAREIEQERAWLDAQPNVVCLGEVRMWYGRFLVDVAEIATPTSDEALRKARADFGTAAIEARLTARMSYDACR